MGVATASACVAELLLLLQVVSISKTAALDGMDPIEGPVTDVVTDSMAAF